MHLPATSSIQKQIAYGDYIATNQFAEKNSIYYAFIMPYSAQNDEEFLKFVSIGTADWINYSPQTENFKYILGILLDTKHIMRTYSRHNGKEILMLSQLILDSLRSYRNDNNI